MTDDELCARLARDVDGVFEQVVLLYQQRLYLFALRYSGCAPDAEEVVQDAFVRAYRALRAYPRAQIAALRLRPWLFQITLNVARNRARGQRIRAVPLDQPDDDTPVIEPPSDPREQPERRAEDAERGRELGRLVASLPERYRAPVILRHVNELSYDEVAALLGQPVGTVKSNVHRGVRLLRERAGPILDR